MTNPPEKPDFTARELADISRLADGTLDPKRRAGVEEWLRASPEGLALYERERRVVELMHEAATGVGAPARLRARIEAQRPSRTAQLRRRLGYGSGLASALAVVVLALVLILPAGTTGGPSVSQAAALGLRGASGPAPTPDRAAPLVKLGRGVEDVYFPNWQARFGWRAVGQRTDLVGDRRAVTVFYRLDDKQVAYTIVAAPALPMPVATVTTLNGTELRTLPLDGRLAVTWRRAGHTCILSATGVSAAVLQELAAWKVPGETR
jgi:anti-sigma factor RsiW